MLQDKQAGEEREEGGNRPGQIGQLKGQHRGNIRATQGQCSGASRDSLAAGEGAGTECETARARKRLAISRGHVVRRLAAGTLPQALPEASSGVSPSHISPPAYHQQLTASNLSP